MALVQEVVLGAYIGVLTGVFAALVVYVLTFAFTYLAGAKLSINYALMIGLGIAGLAGGPRLLLRNPEILQSVTSLVMLLVVLFASFYAHQRATVLGKAVPPTSVALRKLRPRSLSAGVVEGIGRYGQVVVRPTGEVGDLEGYPPVPEGIRGEIRGSTWRFPADLPLAELEGRLEDRLRADHDLADADARIDSEGRATIRVAPRLGGLSRRVPPDTQVVAVETILPGGIASGDDVVVDVGGDAVGGRVVGVAVDDEGGPLPERPDEDAEAGDDEPAVEPTGARPDAVRSGGVGRLAVAVPTDDVEAVLGGEPGTVRVRSHGRLPVFEFVSRLRGEDLRFETVTVGGESELVGVELADVREDHGVVVLAVKRADRWRFAPDPSDPLAAADELYAAGPRDVLAAFREVVA